MAVFGIETHLYMQYFKVLAIYYMHFTQILCINICHINMGHISLALRP